MEPCLRILSHGSIWQRAHNKKCLQRGVKTWSWVDELSITSRVNQFLLVQPGYSSQLPIVARSDIGSATALPRLVGTKVKTSFPSWKAFSAVLRSSLMWKMSFGSNKSAATLFSSSWAHGCIQHFFFCVLFGAACRSCFYCLGHQ